MDFSEVGRCRQRFHPVPRRSSVSSESSSELRFSGFFIVPAGARLFCLGMLALILTSPWNPPSAYAWSFRNDSIPPPPIVMGLDATSPSPSPPADGFLVAPPKVPPSPTLASLSTHLPSESLPSTSMAYSLSSTTRTLGPTPLAKKRKTLKLGVIVGIVVSAFVLGICLPGLLCWYLIFQRPLRIFISYGGASDGLGKNFTIWLNERLKSLLKSRIKIFFDQDYFGLGGIIAWEIIEELARFDVGIVVVTKEYFERKWSMIELIAFVEAQVNDQRKRNYIIPLFYGLTPRELKVHLNKGTWEDIWKEMTRGPHGITVEKCREAVTWLCTVNGIQYNSQRQDFDRVYIDIVCKEIDKILCEERSFASWTKTKMVGTLIQRPLVVKRLGTQKKQKRTNQRPEKKNGLMTYINKWLHFLFALSGLLNILLSVILDNSFNDQPVRFTAFAIFAPITIFWGFLASGWFPRIPLRFIAFIKQRGFLQHVVPCSPWHDNVVTDYCGEVCHLEPLDQAEGTRLFELPLSVQNFLNHDWNAPQRAIDIDITHSTFDSEIQDFQVTTSVQEGQDLQGLTTPNEIFDFTPSSGILKRSHTKIVRSQALLPNLQKVPSQVGDTVIVNIDLSPMFHILGNEQAPILEFNGPHINGFPLTIQAFKNILMKDHNFDLSCTFRNKKTKKMYLTVERLQNFIQNMCQWVENPYPIVVDESSNILHCMAIEDILWEFTKTVYTFRPIYVEHRFLAGLGHIKFFAVLSYVFISFVLSLIPLLSDKKSLFFLFFIFVLIPYLIALDDTDPLKFYVIKSLLCPIYIKIFGFNRLYKSRSSFRWCNEFKKKRIVNPTHFWIDEEYANTFPHAVSCFDVCGFVELPDNRPKDQGFTISCKGWPAGVPAICKIQHHFKLHIKFDSVKLIKDVNCYTNVRLAFFEDDYCLGKHNYTFIEVRRIHLVEKLFHCFSNPSFGGYVERICPRGYCSMTFVAECPRFIDFCDTIVYSNPIPKLLIASRIPGSKFIIGVPFWSLEL